MCQEDNKLHEENVGEGDQDCTVDVTDGEGSGRL